MRKRSQRSSKSRTARNPKPHSPASTAKASQSPGGFLKAWQELLAAAGVKLLL
jgi:hypothetical protein